MIALAAGVIVLVAIGVPHRLALERTPPGFAAAIWLSVLMLRALASLAAVIAAEVYLPVTGWVAPLESWCLQGSSVRSGHDAADLVLALPAVVLAASLCWVMRCAIVTCWSRASSPARDGERLVRLVLDRDHSFGRVLRNHGDVNLAGLDAFK